MDVICPLCQKRMISRALHFHIRNNHQKEYQEIGWRKLKIDSKKIPKEPKAAEEGQKGDSLARQDKDMSSWYDETGQRMYFSPTPVSAAVINQFSKSTDPSDVVNKALNEFATSRGIHPAIIKTEGGKELSLLGGNNEDHEFNRLLKLIAANNQSQQSYNQYTPMYQMIQIMKEKVNNGMNLGQFGRELMQMIMMFKMMEGF